jgi:rifampicin phosphotransferase
MVDKEHVLDVHIEDPGPDDELAGRKVCAAARCLETFDSATLVRDGVCDHRLDLRQQRRRDRAKGQAVILRDWRIVPVGIELFASVREDASVLDSGVSTRSRDLRILGTMAEELIEEVSWEAPGGGLWAHDGSHSDRPSTTFLNSIGNGQVFDGLMAGFTRTGIAQGPVRRALVHGWPYAQQQAPDPATFGDLERAACDFLENRRWVARLAEWERVLRPERLATCHSLQAADPLALSDEDLLGHLDDAISARAAASYRHFEQHSLCVLIGLLLLRTREWGIPDGAVLPLLEGYSPASSRATEHLERIVAALQAAGVVPSTIGDVRGASADAATALDEYLDLHGLQPVAGFDLDARSLAEMPKVVLTSILATMMRPTAKLAESPSDVRLGLAPNDRVNFDMLLADARSVYGLRDDDVFFTLWGSGLVRRALLEVGRRLHGAGRLHSADHVFELRNDELRPMLSVTTHEPEIASADDVAARVSLRAARSRLRPPPTLGEGSPVSMPYDDMPPTVRKMTMAMSTYMQLRRHRPTGEVLSGVGVGSVAYTGRAVVAANADDAFDRIEPGDVLVTPLTTPSFNAVLAICGGLIVEDAGILSHAAVMARELGLSAVLGAAGATHDIPDGSTVTIEPTSGRVIVRG